MDMVSEGFLNTLQKSLQTGKVSMASIDAACKRILEAKYDLGLFEDPFKYCKQERASEVLSADKRAFAKEAAMRSFVLLKNDNQVLPLKQGQKIALIGPLANDRSNMPGTWSINADAKQAVAVLVVLIYSFGFTYLIGWVIDKTMGFRVRNEDELAGIDLVMHGEESYDY